MDRSHIIKYRVDINGGLQLVFTPQPLPNPIFAFTYIYSERRRKSTQAKGHPLAQAVLASIIAGGLPPPAGEGGYDE